MVLQFVSIHLKISHQHGTQTEEGQSLTEIPVINKKDGYEKKNIFEQVYMEKIELQTLFRRESASETLL